LTRQIQSLAAVSEEKKRAEDEVSRLAAVNASLSQVCIARRIYTVTVGFRLQTSNTFDES
jgi:hypothetical protein